MRASTFLMFDGKAEEAMNSYKRLFKEVAIEDVQHWADGEPGPPGKVKSAVVTFAGHRLMFFDSPSKHDFAFTPAISLFVDCDTEAELDRAFAELSAGGKVFMPLDSYGFSQKFGWLSDRFGVSWQLNLP